MILMHPFFVWPDLAPSAKDTQRERSLLLTSQRKDFQSKSHPCIALGRVPPTSTGGWPVTLSVAVFWKSSLHHTKNATPESSIWCFPWAPSWQLHSRSSQMRWRHACSQQESRRKAFECQISDSLALGFDQPFHVFFRQAVLTIRVVQPCATSCLTKRSGVHQRRILMDHDSLRIFSKTWVFWWICWLHVHPILKNTALLSTWVKWTSCTAPPKKKHDTPQSLAKPLKNECWKTTFLWDLFRMAYF